MSDKSKRTLSVRILKNAPPEPLDAETIVDVWAVNSGKSGKLYVDYGPLRRIQVFEADEWYEYQVIKTEEDG